MVTYWTVAKNMHKVSGLEFYSALLVASVLNPRIDDMLTDYTAEEYDEMDCYLFGDGLAGGAVKPDGDMISLFSASPVKGLGKHIQRYRILRGGFKCDCFEGYLTELYKQNGLIVYKREKNWDDPENGQGVTYMVLRSKLQYALENNLLDLSIGEFTDYIEIDGVRIFG